MNSAVLMKTSKLLNQSQDGASQVEKKLDSPLQLKNRLQLPPELAEHIQQHRQAINTIIEGQSEKLLVIMGPCSIHDTKAALDYARRLRTLQQEVGHRCLLVMRAYFEKPRTTVGWKGMLHDPHLDGSNDMITGIHSARSLLLEIASMGIPIATEALSPLAIHYLDDLISWVAIGARTTESQPHREMASGLSCAVGFKNATDGSVQVALDAIRSANAQHGFLGITEEGHVGMVETAGNQYGHLVLRGGNGQPNYDAMNISRCEHALNEAGILPSMIVDCSHENSGKDHIRQAVVVEEVAELIAQGHLSIKGLMLESFLSPGRQDISEDMAYGVSITDACMGWDETERVVRQLAKKD